MFDRDDLFYFAGVGVGLFIGWCFWYRPDVKPPRPMDPPPELPPTRGVTVIVFPRGREPFVQEPAEA